MINAVFKPHIAQAYHTFLQKAIGYHLEFDETITASCKRGLEHEDVVAVYKSVKVDLIQQHPNDKKLYSDKANNMRSALISKCSNDISNIIRRSKQTRSQNTVSKEKAYEPLFLHP